MKTLCCLVILICTLTFGCNPPKPEPAVTQKEPTDKVSTPPSTTRQALAKPKRPKLTDPKPREVKSVLAWNEEPGITIVQVSTEAYTCEQLQRVWMGKAPQKKMDFDAGIITLKLNAVQKLSEDGTLIWKLDGASGQIHHLLTGSSMGMSTDFALNNNGMPQEGVLSGTFTVPYKDEADDGAIKLEISGDFDAQHCGTKPYQMTIPPRPKGLIFTLAKHDFPVQGATLHPEGDDLKLTLSTHPHDCNNIPGDEQHLGVLVIQYRGPEHNLESAQISGIRFEGFSQYSSVEGLTFSVGNLTEQETRITLKGDTKVGSYDATFKGATTALVCRK